MTAFTATYTVYDTSIIVNNKIGCASICMQSDVSWWNVCCTKLMATCNINCSYLWVKLHSVSFGMKKKITPRKIPAVCTCLSLHVLSQESWYYHRYDRSAHYQSLTSTPLIAPLSSRFHNEPSPQHAIKMMTYHATSQGGNTCMGGSKHQHQKIIAAGLTGGGGGGGGGGGERKEMLL